MSFRPDRELDFAIHQLLFSQADTSNVPLYSTTHGGYLLVEARVEQRGWTVSTERQESLTRVTLQHADGRRAVGEGVDQFEAACKAAIQPDVIRTDGERS